MSLRYHPRGRSHQSIVINMTTMVDVVFLLIIFFALVSQFISAESVMVELPDPDRSLAKKMETPQQVILNCQFIPGEGSDPLTSGVRYRLGPAPVEDLDDLEARLTRIKKERPDVQIVVRADKKVRYVFVRDVMKVIARAGIENLGVAAEIESGI